MSQLLILGAINRLPTVHFSGAGANASITLNAAGETCVFAGHIILENPLGGSKTISAAGGGSITWIAGAVTFASGSSTFKVGIQDVHAAASPTQGDGTFDVEASFTGGGGGVTASAVNTSVMTSGTKAINHGDMAAVVLSLTARGGADSIVIRATPPASISLANNGFPTVSEYTTGSYAKTASAVPLAVITFDDGTLGWFHGAPFFNYNNTPTSLAYNSGTATADEYGNYLNYPFTYNAIGITFLGQISGTSADAELLLYSDPLGTPVVERTITLDATQAPVTASVMNSIHLFSTPFQLKANTPYAVTMRPTTANNITLYHRDVGSVAQGETSEIGTYCYACRRLDNTGAFSDYNGGTAKTRLMSVSLAGTYMEQGVNICSGQVGVY